MAGLVQQAQGAQAAEGEPATESEQDAYNTAVQMASELIHANDESSAAMVEKLKNAEDPAQAIAEVTDLIIDKIEEAFGGELPETVIIPAADEISDFVMEMGEESGAFTIDVATADRAKGAVMQALIETYGIEEGDMDKLLAGTTPEDIAQYEQTFGAGNGTTA